MAASTNPSKPRPLAPDRSASEDWLQPVYLEADAFTQFSRELSESLEKLVQNHGRNKRSDDDQADFIRR